MEIWHSVLNSELKHSLLFCRKALVRLYSHELFEYSCLKVLQKCLKGISTLLQSGRLYFNVAIACFEIESLIPFPQLYSSNFWLWFEIDDLFFFFYGERCSEPISLLLERPLRRLAHYITWFYNIYNNIHIFTHANLSVFIFTWPGRLGCWQMITFIVALRETIKCFSQNQTPLLELVGPIPQCFTMLFVISFKFNHIKFERQKEWLMWKFTDEYIIHCLAQTFDHRLRQRCSKDKVKIFITVE